jgi:hypothetical protein
VIEALEQEKDNMKRIRKNGGARDILSREGISTRWRRKDKVIIENPGLPSCSKVHFISLKPETESDIALLRRAGHID